MEFSAQQIAQLLEGIVLGNNEEKVSYISKIEEGISGTLTFLGGQKYMKFLYETKASIVLISKELKPESIEGLPTLVVVEDAYEAFTKLLHLYNEMKPKKEGRDEYVAISDTAILGERLYLGSFVHISSGVSIGDDTRIYPQCYIGENVKIGKNCFIGPGVKIYDDCVIGDDCIIHAGAVIGSDGFGFQPTPDGYKKVPQLGNVVIEDDVEIGANTVLDRATMGSTIVRKGAKLDNLIQVGHNVEIGSYTVMAAQSGVAGSTKIGKWNMIGGQAGIAGHLEIGDKIQVQAQAGINGDVKSNQVVFGTPAIDASNYRRSYVHFKQLQSIVDRIKKLEEDKK